MNPLDHGSYADPYPLADHLEGEDLAIVEQLIETYLDRYDGEPDLGVIHDTREAAVILWQEASARSELLDDGLSQDEAIGVDDSGAPVVVSSNTEHRLVKTRSRLIRDAEKLLKRHGLLEDPASTSASAQQTVASVFAAAQEEYSEDSA